MSHSPSRLSKGVSFTLAVALTLAMGSACTKKTKAVEVEQVIEAAPIGHAECAACGMVVREQPAPRVQAIHRDGTRVYFCSMSDSLHYLKDHNAHGKAAGVFVEALPADADPAILVKEEQPWVRVENASYVTGLERPGVMGAPVMAFQGEKEAKASAQEHGGTVQSWDTLRTGKAPH